jgi:hypothetical protein
MAGTKRTIGREILDGIREIKPGQHGRVTKLAARAARYGVDAAIGKTHVISLRKANKR